MSRLLASAKTGVRRQGKQELLKHLTGNRLTRNQAIKAKCYDCMGMGECGICDTPDCSIFPYSPYKQVGEVKRAFKRPSQTKDVGVEL